MSIPLIYQEEKYYFPRTEQIWIKFNNLLSNLCHVSKNLYNEANYIVRQEFTKKDKDGNSCGAYLNYNIIDYLIKDKSRNYRKLPAQTAQQILKILDRNWKSFFEAIKDWKINPNKYIGRPKLPGYLKKDGEFVLYFTDQQVMIVEDNNGNRKIKFPKSMYFLNGKIKTRIKSVIKELRIIPKGKKVGYLIDLVYRKEVNNIKNLDKNRIIGLDFGLRNIVTISNNIGIQPIIIKGGVLKSINQYYNKKLAELKSIYSKQCIIIDDKKQKRLTGPAIQILTNNRNKKIKDVMHKYSRFIIKYCIKHNIGTIVIGHNDNWKQEINLGKKTNQNFVQIPYYLLGKMIKYKSEEIGIDVKEQDESHTSKCSFLDDEPIGHRDLYMGKRIYNATCHGGLFRSSFTPLCRGKIINADVQGAYNIIKKAIPKAFMNLKVIRTDGIEGVGLHPIRINPLVVNRSIDQLKLINARNINVIGG